MSVLSTLFEQFLRERRYLRNVTPKTVMWYQTAFDALTRTVGAPDASQLRKPVLQDFVVRLRERGCRPSPATPTRKLSTPFSSPNPGFTDYVTPSPLRRPSGRSAPPGSCLPCRTHGGPALTLAGPPLSSSTSHPAPRNLVIGQRQARPAQAVDARCRLTSSQFRYLT